MAVKEFPCGHCGKVFSQIGNLQRHVAVMHEDPKLQCAECPQMFHHKVFSPFQLSQIPPLFIRLFHMFTLSSLKQGKQVSKGLSMVLQRELTRHSWSHGPPQFPCTRCDQAFRNPDQLENHVQVHTISREVKAHLFLSSRLSMKRRKLCCVVKNVTESSRQSLVCEFI